MSDGIWVVVGAWEWTAEVKQKENHWGEKIKELRNLDSGWVTWQMSELLELMGGVCVYGDGGVGGMGQGLTEEESKPDRRVQ